jgi:thiamine pyrophosphokinase
MKAFIYTGGAIYPENITEHPKGDDIRIAADAGVLNAKRLGERIDVALGDFDSLRDRVSEIQKDVERVTVPAEKDETDTQLAVSEALRRGADELVIIGGLDGRLDHTLSNMAILEAMWEHKIPTVIANGQNRVRYIRSTSTLIARSGYKYLSIIAADDVVKGVSVEGCKYPLENARLSRKFQYAVSNEIVGNCALISVKKGGIYIIESRDI